jgi:VWFA-related protein
MQRKLAFPLTLTAGFLVILPTNLISQAPKNEGTLKVGVTEVYLDAVVTDRKGRQIRDLRPEEFEVFEDGVLQKLTSNRLFSGEMVTAARGTEPATPEGKPETGLRRLNLITLVFDRIAMEGRKLARDAARQYFKELGPDDYVSVMAIDRALRVLQPFTNDTAKLQAAVGLAADGTPQQFESVSNRVREELQKAQEASDRATAGAASAGQAGGPAAGTGENFAEAKTREMVSNMLRHAQVIDEAIQGRATVESLLNVIQGLQNYQGRKAVIFFAERINLPTQVVARYKDLISASNRANVSFYSVDSRGLNSAGELTEMSQELRTLAGVSQRQATKRSGGVTREEATLEENANNVLRRSAQNSLADLAVNTGGILITNTNDLRPGLRHVTEDLHSHYELTYVPSNTNFNGEFRKVEVKVKRPGMLVRSRQGYYAIRSTDATIGAFELPMISALEAKVLPREINYRSISLVYPTAGPKAEAVLYLEIPLADFDFPGVESTKVAEYQAKVDVMVVVKNQEGRVLERYSQEFPLRGPKEKATETKTKNLVFYRTAELLPGRYTMEAVVHDGISGKTSVKRSILVVPEKPAKSVALSSVIAVKRLDVSRSDSGLMESPLNFNKQMVVPLLNPELSSQEWPELAFYFVAVRPEGVTGETIIDVIISKEGKPVGHMGQRPLPPPDDKGRIPYLAKLPLATFGTGNFDVNVLVQNGDVSSMAATTFAIH